MTPYPIWHDEHTVEMYPGHKHTVAGATLFDRINDLSRQVVDCGNCKRLRDETERVFLEAVCMNCGHARHLHPTPDLCGGEDGLGCHCGGYVGVTDATGTV